MARRNHSARRRRARRCERCKRAAVEGERFCWNHRAMVIHELTVSGFLEPEPPPSRAGPSSAPPPGAVLRF